MSWWSEFESRMERDVPLARHTWFRVGGPAEFYFRPRDAQDLAALTERARQENVPVKVLGSGANVLICDDGIDGVVVRLDDPGFSYVRPCDGGLDVGAGAELMSLSRRCSATGLSGLEGLAGIPATIGGAVRMNAGGRFGELGDIVEDVELLRSDGVVERRTRDGMAFGYRTSGVGDGIVLSARLALTNDDPDRVWKRFSECFEFKKASQPLADHSAGCVFKNPPGESAGGLIDRAGLKGFACGGASVSERHANFIVTRRGATASDVVELIEAIRERIDALFGIWLELELEIWHPAAPHEHAA